MNRFDGFEICCVSVRQDFRPLYLVLDRYAGSPVTHMIDQLYDSACDDVSRYRRSVELGAIFQIDHQVILRKLCFCFVTLMKL